MFRAPLGNQNLYIALLYGEREAFSDPYRKRVPLVTCKVSSLLTHEEVRRTLLNQSYSTVVGEAVGTDNYRRSKDLVILIRRPRSRWGRGDYYERRSRIHRALTEFVGSRKNTEGIH